MCDRGRIALGHPSSDPLVQTPTYDRRIRITGLGIVLIAIMAAGVLAALFGSGRGAGLVVVAAALVLLLLGGSEMGRGRRR